MEDADTEQELHQFEVDRSQVNLGELVGTGCTAEVYLGTFNGEHVAVKQIDWSKSNLGAKEQRAFNREVAIMTKANHPNLVKFIGVASQAQPLQIITEFCAGGCLFELLHNQDDVELVWAQQHKMCTDVALAMDYLHKFNPQIIHRDLKSLNLLLVKPISSCSSVPVVKVSDFGLSRMKDGAQTDWGKMTIAAGTCHWMAPEVFNGTRYDEKVDVYSYAMILFEIICREIPFEDEEPAEVGRLAVQGARPDVEAIPPDCPQVLSQLMISCWAGNPRKRPSFDSIVDTLKQVSL